MAQEFIVEELGEGIDEGEVLNWVKKEGDRVEKGEVVLEIATEKANIEVEAPASGYLRGIAAKEGEQIAPGKVIAYIADTMEEEI